MQVLNGQRDTAKRRVTIVSKGSLMSLIHDKTLKSNNDDHSAITLIGNDVEDVQMAMGWFHVIWSSLLSLGLGLYLLTSKLGWVSLVPIALVASTWFPCHLWTVFSV